MKSNRKLGQAAVEYVLMIAVVTVIFGALFTAIRQNIYKLWICEMSPRIQAPAGCRESTRDCWQSINTPPANYCPQ